ncbi:MAG: hypothetical protein KF803_13130 [Cyclobacteriaceae bacterium]|nr:hypothetical protein [Cyclobacteriaceae bacterium]
MKLAVKKLDFLILYIVASICTAGYLRNVILDVAAWLQNFKQDVATTF